MSTRTVSNPSYTEVNEDRIEISYNTFENKNTSTRNAPQLIRKLWQV